MNQESFVAEDWVDKLVSALASLANVQKHYLLEYDRRYPVSPFMYGCQDFEGQAFPLDDLRMLYARARSGNTLGEEEHYAPLSKALNPVRHVLISHPTLERVYGRIIGRDGFSMDILNTGGEISPADLIAGLFARADELQRDGFRKAARELHAFLSRSAEDRVPGELDVGYDMVLIWGLTLNERIDLADGVILLPFKEIEAYVSQDVVHKYAPSFTGFHHYKSVGGIGRSFHWKPEFYPAGRLRDGALSNPGPFFREVQAFLELLSVAHETPILLLATLDNCIHASASRLLGMAHQNSNPQRGRSAEEFDGLAECPPLNTEAFADAEDAFKHRHSERHKRLAPIIHRLAEALARDRPFAGADRILDVSIALEHMYELGSWRVSTRLQDRASRFLGKSTTSQQRYSENAKEFYTVRSKIVHGQSDELTTQRTREAFTKGYEIARRTLFKLLREDPPKDWDR